MDVRLKMRRVVSFYSDNEEDIEEGEEEKMILQMTYTDDESYIKIPNENDILNHRTNELIYEIYRGDTSKRTVYFYLNSEKIFQIELGKYSGTKGRVKLPLNNSKNVITISGLDIKEVITIPNREDVEDEVNETNSILASNDAKDTREKQYFNLMNLRVNNSVLFFEIHTNLNSYEGDCYIRYVRTKVSNVYNITQNVSQISLPINVSKLEEKEELVSYNLSLICKYKKTDLKTFKYASESFVFSVNEDSNPEITEFENNSILFDSADENKSSTLSLKEEREEKEVEDYEIVFESQNEKTKLNSQYFILLGLSSLLGVILFKW